MYRGILNEAELKAEPANLEVIQSKMITFHIKSTTLNVGQSVLPTENVSKLRKLLLKCTVICQSDLLQTASEIGSKITIYFISSTIRGQNYLHLNAQNSPISNLNSLVT